MGIRDPYRGHFRKPDKWRPYGGQEELQKRDKDPFAGQRDFARRVIRIKQPISDATDNPPETGTQPGSIATIKGGEKDD